MKVFGIAKGSTVCRGHGDYGEEFKIERMGPYETGPFPPVFTTPIAAAAWAKANLASGRVVELELINLDPPSLTAMLQEPHCT